MRATRLPIEHAPQTNPVAQSNADANDLNDAHSILAKRSVYFDFDKFNIKSEYDTLIQAHAKYLVNHPNQKIIIQGNTDDRGSAEYNLALGQRRSEAIRKALHLLGAPDSQMEAISFGKEKPMASGEEESAWSKNRRADIVYQQH